MPNFTTVHLSDTVMITKGTDGVCMFIRKPKIIVDKAIIQVDETRIPTRIEVSLEDGTQVVYGFMYKKYGHYAVQPEIEEPLPIRYEKINVTT